ncbi:TRAP transporter substrate-binding protein [Thermatribacter velox]|uniref:TRAP transporter substrate-binding protein n=1 Tax=Thermatribacter velox TaxID=3039681 RepID=A0ABZ2YDF1_9BACT
MKRFYWVIVFMVLCFFLLGLSGIAGAVMHLKYGHVERTEDPQHQFALYLSNRVKELTEGRIIIDVYPHAQLGEVNELINGVKSGIIEMGHHVFASLAQVYPDAAVFSLPYLYRDIEHGIKAVNPETSPVMQKINEELMKKGNMLVLGAYTRGYRHLSANFPVYSPADLKGKKIRGVPLQMWTSLIKGMGAIPVPVAIAEVPTALMTGLIEGQENPLAQMWASKLYEVQSHIMLTGHMVDLLCVFINRNVWERIPESDRELIKQAMAETSEYSLKFALEKEEEYIQMFKEKGVTIITKEDGLDVDAFREAVLEQVRKDFPEWTGYIEEIQKIDP